MSEIISNYNPEAEKKEFFSKIEVKIVLKDEFLSIMKKDFPEKSEEDLLKIKGYNYKKDGKIYVIMRKDIFPEKYLPYLEIHEKEEAFIARRDGFNLWDNAKKKYKKSIGKSIEEDLTEVEKSDFYNNLEKYKFEFRHEYAVWKEYSLANKDGILDEYHKWVQEFIKKEKAEGSVDLEVLENDSKIRNGIYDKIKKGKKYYFQMNKK